LPSRRTEPTVGLSRSSGHCGARGRIPFGVRNHPSRLLDPARDSQGGRRCRFLSLRPPGGRGPWRTRLVPIETAESHSWSRSEPRVHHVFLGSTKRTSASRTHQLQQVLAPTGARSSLPITRGRKFRPLSPPLLAPGDGLGSGSRETWGLRVFLFGVEGGRVPPGRMPLLGSMRRATAGTPHAEVALNL
jgi:hypothetical protein